MSDDAVRDALAEMLAALPITNTSDGTAGGFGIDLICFDDLAPDFGETNPDTTASLAQDNYHRLITDAGSLADDLDYGTNIESFLSRGTTLTELQLMSGEIETELLKDDRNSEVSASVAPTALLPTRLLVTIIVTPKDPNLEPFKQIIAITPDGVAVQSLL